MEHVVATLLDDPAQKPVAAENRSHDAAQFDFALSQTPKDPLDVYEAATATASRGEWNGLTNLFPRAVSPASFLDLEEAALEEKAIAEDLSAAADSDTPGSETVSEQEIQVAATPETVRSASVAEQVPVQNSEGAESIAEASPAARMAVERAIAAHA